LCLVLNKAVSSTTVTYRQYLSVSVTVSGGEKEKSVEFKERETVGCDYLTMLFQVT